MTGSLQGLNVVVAGATSAAGIAAASALSGAGAAVIAVGRDQARLEESLAGVDRVTLRACDLTDFGAVQALEAQIAADSGGVDGLVHLVGGWRGGEGIAGQKDDDWDFLHRNILTTLRNTSRVFFPHLARSGHGRLVIVSATAVDHPTASGAAYGAVKSAAESWIRSVAEGLAREQSRHKEHPVRQQSAACILVVKALLDEAMKAAAPEKAFPGFTHVDELATAIVNVFDEDAAVINGERFVLA
jgi:3-oxoacyl-[acyl-carrier protein] reductase